VDVRLPKLALAMPVETALKLVWLKALNKSPRICKKLSFRRYRDALVHRAEFEDECQAHRLACDKVQARTALHLESLRFDRDGIGAYWQKSESEFAGGIGMR
jgi:hypothetical protein